MLASSATVLPRGAEWTYEVKWDGYRTIALKDGARVKLFSRNLKDATSQCPPTARAIAQLHADTALLDGELVAVDERGLPAFQALHISLLRPSFSMRSICFTSTAVIC
jgi:bifunctional non-homologous end joining protein LigD